jgi:hypothetical protein
MPDPKANVLVAFYSRDGSVEALAKAVVKERVKPEPKSGSAAYPISFLRR